MSPARTADRRDSGRPVRTRPISRRPFCSTTIETLSRTSGRTSVATKPSGRTISTTLHVPDSPTDTCETRGSFARASASIVWQSSTFFGEGDEAQRIGVAVEMAVGARGRRRLGALGRIEQPHRLGRTADRALGNLVGVGEGGRLARDAAQPETGLRVEVGGLEPAVVEAEALRREILQIEFAVVGRRQRLRAQPPRGIGIEPVAVEEGAGIGEAGHCRDIGGRGAGVIPPIPRHPDESTIRGLGRHGLQP